MEQNSKTTAWLIAHSAGIITSKKQADTTIIIFSIVAIVVSIYLFGKSIHVTPPSSEKTGTPRPTYVNTTNYRP